MSEIVEASSVGELIYDVMVKVTQEKAIEEGNNESCPWLVMRIANHLDSKGTLEGLTLTKADVAFLENTLLQEGGKRKGKKVQRGGFLAESALAILVGLGTGLARLCGSTTTTDDEKYGKKHEGTAKGRRELAEHMADVSRETAMRRRRIDMMNNANAFWNQLKMHCLDLNYINLEIKTYLQKCKNNDYDDDEIDTIEQMFNKKIREDCHSTRGGSSTHLRYSGSRRVVHKDGRRRYIKFNGAVVYLSEIRGKYEMCA